MHKLLEKRKYIRCNLDTYSQVTKQLQHFKTHFQVSHFSQIYILPTAPGIHNFHLPECHINGLKYRLFESCLPLLTQCI